MKKAIIKLIVLSLFVAVGCNRDEDLTIDNPDNNQQGGSKPEEIPASLGYRVIEYLPAPGQYVNEAVSGFDNLVTQAEACRQAEYRFLRNSYVSLGSWGGYIVIKFDKPVLNSGNYDFSIGSNTFDSSNEPGIVWVMQDSNGNGLPDDIWYELKGSHFGEPGYERNYWVEYQRPKPKGDTPWIDSNGESGVITWMGSYHSQDFYYPSWIEEDSYVLYGSRLPLQASQNPETGIWTNLPFAWGYVDNYGSDFNQSQHRNYFKISDAVTEFNADANLHSIDFVKVQTAINGAAGWLGENSTEVTGFFTD